MTADRRSLFLQAVLGQDGARALLKASERSPELGNALWPRTILAWLHTVRGDFEGELPGVENTYLQFAKSEQGYSGSISIGDEVYRLEKASVFELLASVAVALDLDKQPAPGGIRDLDLERLGKSIDVLAKAKMVARELAKAEEEPTEDEVGTRDKTPCPECGIDIYRTRHGKIGFHSGGGKKCPGSGKDPLKKEELEKAKPTGPGTGMAHAPTPPDAPTPPTSTAPPPPAPKPKMTKPKVAQPARPVASHTLKLSQSEAWTPCALCGVSQFHGAYFTGCRCFRGIFKSAKVTVEPNSQAFLVKLGEDWDQEAIVTLLEAMGRR